MDKKYKGEFRLNGKTYSCEVISGVPYIEGKIVEQFVETLDIMTIVEFVRVGKQAISDEINGTKTKTYQSMMDTFHQIKNN